MDVLEILLVQEAQVLESKTGPAMTVPTENAATLKSSNRETLIPRYRVVQISNEILI